MREKIHRITDKYLMRACAYAGIPLVFYGAWFQTEGFTFADAPLSSCFLAVFLGGIIGGMVMSYFSAATKKQQPGRRPMTRTDALGLLRGNVLVFILCTVLLYTARSLGAFYFGLGGMMYAVVTCLYYLIWGRVEERRKENNAPSGSAGKAS